MKNRFFSRPLKTNNMNNKTTSIILWGHYLYMFDYINLIQFCTDFRLMKAFTVALKSSEIVENESRLARHLGVSPSTTDDVSSTVPLSQEERCMAVFMRWRSQTPACSVSLLQQKLLTFPRCQAVAGL